MDVFEKIKESFAKKKELNINNEMFQIDKSLFDVVSLKEYRLDDKEIFNEQDKSNGHNELKAFFRLNSEYCEELLKSLKISNSGYKTCINDYVIKEKALPNKVSTMVKEFLDIECTLNDDMAVISEVLASRVLNYYGVPTPYNAVMTYEKNGKTIYALASTDFISYGEKFENILDILKTTINTSNLSNDINNLKYELNRKAFAKFSSRTKNKFLEDYAMSYIVRKYILDDIDFAPRNIGVLINNDKNNLQLINFDFEYSFMFHDEVAKSLFSNERLNNFEYLYVYFPRAFKRFVEKTRNLLDLKWCLKRIDYLNHENAIKVEMLIKNADMINNELSKIKRKREHIILGE